MRQTSTEADALESHLRHTVERLLRDTGCTKRSAVRHALIHAIYTGLLQPGDLLPPERRLATALGVSLGTVQAALDQLRQAGRVARRRGDGTRVTENTDIAHNTWHFRLLDRSTGRPVFWVKSAVETEALSATGPWAEFLGTEGPFVRVRRRIRMLGGLPVGADMYLPMTTGRPFLRMNPTDLALINLRAVLVERFGLDTTRLTTQITTRTIFDTEAAVFGLRSQAPVFVIDARVHSGGDAPLYFQRVLAGSDDFALSF